MEELEKREAEKKEQEKRREQMKLEKQRIKAAGRSAQELESKMVRMKLAQSLQQ
jgi:hypothetical protein